MTRRRPLSRPSRHSTWPPRLPLSSFNPFPSCAPLGGFCCPWGLLVAVEQTHLDAEAGGSGHPEEFACCTAAPCLCNSAVHATNHDAPQDLTVQDAAMFSCSHVRYSFQVFSFFESLSFSAYFLSCKQLSFMCRGPGTHIHLSWPTKTRWCGGANVPAESNCTTWVSVYAAGVQLVSLVAENRFFKVQVMFV